MVNHKTVRQFSAESGYSEAAIRAKISDGTWTKNIVWRHAPDSRVLIDVRGYEKWVESTGIPKLVAFRPPKTVISQRGLASLSPAPLI